jgi:hypothetical protein
MTQRRGVRVYRSSAVPLLFIEPLPSSGWFTWLSERTVLSTSLERMLLLWMWVLSLERNSELLAVLVERKSVSASAEKPPLF